MKKQLISIITALALTLNAGTASVIASELPVVGNWKEITADEPFVALDSTSNTVATSDFTPDPSVADVASLSLQQQLERKQQRAAASEGEISAFALGDSETEPFYISNAAQLAELATLVKDRNTGFNRAYYKLLNNIDLSAYAVGATVDGVEYTTGWTPIGTNASRFEGTFDGQNHKITNLTINSKDNYQGLFGYATGKIQNLGVEDVSVAGQSYVGGVAGYAGDNVSNCYATGSVSGTQYVGGVGGAVSSVSNCYATGSVSGTNYVGGVVGAVSSVSNCYATVSVSVSGENNAGGVVGYAKGDVSNCYATGSVSGTNYVGGVVGNAAGNVSNCYATGSVSGTKRVGGVVGYTLKSVSVCVALNPSVSGSSHVWAVAGGGTLTNCFYWNQLPGESGANALTYSDGLKYDRSSFLWADFTDANGWNLDSATTLPTLKNVGGTQSSTLPVHITGGATAESIVYIRTAEELEALATAVNGGNNYAGKLVQLMNDIDLSAYFKGATVGNVTYTNGWTPIGTDAKPFAGTFDGQNHKITNLTIDNSEADYQGLFGYSTGSIKNLGVVDVSVKGGGNVGGVVGYATGNVSNCYATGSVSGTVNVGGVIGSAYTVSNCYATGSVSGTEKVGGVVGSAYAQVSNCYATGSVSGTQYVGGVVGAAYTVSNSYATGSVSGTGDYVGGVVGSSAGDVSNCVALNPSVSGISLVGAVAGRFTTTATDCFYWGSMSVMAGSSPVTAPTNGTTKLTYSGGLKHGDSATDFAWSGFTSDNWNPISSITLSTLKTVGGTQSNTLPAWITRELDAETIVSIRTAADLKKLADAVNGGNTYADQIVRLMNDIDLSGYAEGTGWTPIGTDDTKAFAGTFDGRNQKITNLTIDNSTADNQGLFGYVSGTIQNLGVEEVSIKGKSNVGSVAGFAATGSTVTKCYATGDVNGAGNAVGGVVGYAVGAVSNAYTTAKVSGSEFVGGVVGHTEGEVSNCYATGGVSAMDTAGGVVGGTSETAEISNCVALNSTISGTNSAGAVVGSGMAATSFYWVGITGNNLVKPAAGVLTQTGGKLMNSDADFVWTGYPTENVWTIPTQPLLLPQLTGTSYKASMSPSSTIVTTHTVTLEHPTGKGEIQYSVDNTNWTTYTSDVLTNWLAGEIFTVYVKKDGYTAAINGHETVGQWSGTITDNTTLTTVLTPIEYKIIYHLGGGALEESKTNPEKYTVEDNITLNNPVRDRYTFAGWTMNDSTEANVNVTIEAGSTGDKSYTATWTPTEYPIHYDLANGKWENTTTEHPTYNTEESITLDQPIRDGYTFAGWTGEDLTTATLSVTIPTGRTGAKSYTATWSLPIEYKITYHLGGGALEESKANPEKYTVEDNITLENPSRTGYTFAGWTMNDSTEANVNVTIEAGSTGDTSYTATWTPTEYPIHYDLANGEWENTTTEHPTYNTEESITLEQPIRDGYTFAGWTGEDLENPTTSVTIPTGSTGDRTYTATWTQMTYAITSNTDNDAAFTVSNFTGNSKNVVVIFAIHDENNVLQITDVQKHTFAVGADNTITWTHDFGTIPANLKVFILEPNGLAPLLVKAAEMA